MVYENLIPLFNSGQWTLHANATSSPDGKTLTLNATAGFQQSYVTFAVTPNTLFDLAFTASGSVGVYGMDGGNAIAIMNYSAVAGGQRRFNSGRFTSIRIYLSNESAGAGTFTFSNLSLTRVQPGDPYANKVPLFSDAGWVIQTGAWATAPDGSNTTLTANAPYQARRYTVSVTPNTIWEFEFTGTGKVCVFDPSGSVQLVVYKTAGKYQFNSGRYTSVQVYLSNADLGNGTFTWGPVTLRKVHPGDPYRNPIPLFSDAAWTRHANTSVSPDGKTLTLNATAGSQVSLVRVPVTPSSVYDVTFTITGALPAMVVDMNWGRRIGGSVDVSYRSGAPYAINRAAGTYTVRLTTGADQGQQVLQLYSTVEGTFTFSNLELRRVQPGDPYANLAPLFNDAAWVTSGGTWTPSADGTSVTEVATGTYQGRYILRDVAPNTLYSIAFSGTGRVFVSDATGGTGFIGYVAAGTYQFNTGNNRQIRVYCTSGALGAGTYTWNELTLRRVQPGDPYRELVTNGGFDQGATGWQLTQYASVVEGRLQISGNVVAYAPEVQQYIDVKPLTTYELKAETSGANGYLQCMAYNGGTYLNVTNDLGSVGGSKVFTTPVNCNRVLVKLTRSSTTAGTAYFDNVSLKKKHP